MCMQSVRRARMIYEIRRRRKSTCPHGESAILNLAKYQVVILSDMYTHIHLYICVCTYIPICTYACVCGVWRAGMR